MSGTDGDGGLAGGGGVLPGHPHAGLCWLGHDSGPGCSCDPQNTGWSPHPNPGGRRSHNEEERIFSTHKVGRPEAEQWEWGFLCGNPVLYQCDGAEAGSGQGPWKGELGLPQAGDASRSHPGPRAPCTVQREGLPPGTLEPPGGGVDLSHVSRKRCRVRPHRAMHDWLRSWG